MKCPAGAASPPAGASSARTEGNGLSIAAAVPTQRGWSFAVENTGTVGAAGTLNARCLEK